MKSWILTCLYLFKDTLHRWKERPASPLSRILVAFFLSLCALSFLANYVLSAKMLHDEIRKNGADLIIVFDTVRDGEPSKKNLLQHELPSLYGCDVLVLNDARAGVARVGKTVFPILEYNMESCSFLSALGLEDVATVLLYNPSRSPLQAGPCTVTIADFDFSLNASPLPEGHLLGRLYPSGVILAPEGTFSSGQEVPVENCRYIIRVHEMTAARIRDIEEVLNNMVRYDGSMTMVQTHVGLLDRLEVLMGNQTECRTGFSLGIAVIVGILLTALASMEFRQNEYVYTLMKSFGVRPVLLIMAFIVENAFLIGVSFAGAVWAFMKTQRIVLGAGKLRPDLCRYTAGFVAAGNFPGGMCSAFLHSGCLFRLPPHRESAQVSDGASGAAPGFVCVPACPPLPAVWEGKSVSVPAGEIRVKKSLPAMGAGREV